MARTDRHDAMDPSARDVQMDVVEWRSYAALQDTSSPELLQQRADAFETALEALGGEIPGHGRFFNRVYLTALFVDFSQRPIYQEDGDEDDEYALSTLRPESWEEFKDQLLLVRSNLLRKDADCNTTQEQEDASINQNLAALPKFSTECDAVVSLLDLQQIVARFRRALLGLTDDNRTTSILRQVEAAVNDYNDSLKTLSESGTALTLDSDSPLTSFMLADMYKTKTKDLPQRLCQHLDTVMGDDENCFSYTETRNKMRRLLQKWNASVLSVPTLVRLGYHGRNVTQLRKMSMDSNASVSSWGVDEDEYKERQQVEATITQERVIARQASAGDDTDEYATADEAEAAAAFAFATQPPPQVPDDSDKESDKFPMESDKEDDEESSDDLDKKPKAKPAPSQKESPPKKLPRRSSRIVEAPAPAASGASGTARRAPTKTTATLPQAQNQEKSRAQDDESITDPESSSPAKRAVARNRPPVRGTKVPFVIEWSSESEDEVGRTATPKKRARKDSVTPKKRKAKKRRPFSDEEKEAIRTGVRRFGVGQWAVIRLNSGGVLMSRTNVNIKDCHRNMVKRGEL